MVTNLRLAAVSPQPNCLSPFIQSSKSDGKCVAYVCESNTFVCAIVHKFGGANLLITPNSTTSFLPDVQIINCTTSALNAAWLAIGILSFIGLGAQHSRSYSVASFDDTRRQDAGSQCILTIVVNKLIGEDMCNDKIRTFPFSHSNLEFVKKKQ